MAGSSSPQTRQSVFSLDSQAGVMQLLASIRASELSPETKNELRDLVFLYTNGGHDESVKISLEKKLAEHNVVAVAAKTNPEPTTKPTAQPTIGTFRSAPSFKVAPAATPAREASPEPKSEQTNAPAVEPTPAPEVNPAAAEPAPTQTPPPPPAPEPTPQPAPTPAPAAPAQPAPETSTASGPVDSKALDRIKEIKAEVNTKVGNPVQLVDANPELGREYMSALLEAMKKVNSGSQAVEAMARLEKVRTTIVESNLTPKADSKETTEPVAPSATQPDPESEKTPAPAPEPAQPASVVDVKSASSRASILDESESQEPAPAPAKSEPRKVPEPVRPFTPPVVETPSYNQTTTNQAASNPVPVSQTPTAKPDPVPIKSTSRPTFATESMASQVDAPAGVPATPNQPPASPIASLSNPLIKGQGNNVASKEGNPLMTPEVDAGLNQLLEEWPIFKKSGLFGTGPKGREHPLFKKIADLQIPLLLAGRFEGATQEIKQSITDYMNGWRYEQGLIYEQGETFEHYLRRVIRHILDIQKSRM